MPRIRTAHLAALAVSAMLVACGDQTEQSMLGAARVAIDRNDLVAAKIPLQNTLEKNKDSAEGRFLFGKLLLRMGEAAAAEIELKKAQALHYPIDQVAPELARSLIAMGKSAIVIEEYSSLTLKDPDRQADLVASIATALGLTGQRDKASALIDSALTGSPDGKPLLLVKARLIADKGDVDGALNLLDKILAREPGNIESLLLRGDLVLFGKGDRQAALESFRKLLEVNKSNLHAQIQIVTIHLLGSDTKAATQQYESLAKLKPMDSRVQLLGARLALLNGKPEKAKELTAQLLKFNKDDPTILFLAAASEFDLKSLSQAEGHLNKLLASHPNFAPARAMLADIHVRNAQPARALEVLRPILESRNPNSVALSLAAEANLAAGDTKSAEAFFSRVVKLNPNDTQARTAIALLQLAKGNADNAIIDLKSIAAGDAGTIADMALINVQLRQRDFDAALKSIDGLERKMPDRALPDDLRGRAFLSKRDFPAARASFERALSRDPMYLPAVTTLAAMDSVDRKFEAAAQRFDDLLKKDPKNVGALLGLARLRARATANPQEVAQLFARAIEARPTNPEAHLSLINFWLNTGSPKSAVAAAQAGVAASPDAPELLDALGQAQLANGEHAQALTTLGKLALQRPRSALPQLRIAEVQKRLKNLGAAEAAVRKALEISPDMLGAQRELIALSIQTKHPDNALRVAKTIQTQRPDQALGHVLEGDLQLASNNIDAAISSFRNGLEKQGGAFSCVRLHQALVTARRNAEAERFSVDWLRRNPRDTILRMHLGHASLAGGNLPAAEDYYRQILRIEPESVIALNNLALTLARARKTGALEIAERAVALSGDAANSLDTLAIVLGEEGNLPRAIEAAKSALRLDPDAASFRLTLAKMYIKANDHKNARVELQKLAELGARFPQQAEVSNLLKSI